jgi:hypothetical protein
LGELTKLRTLDLNGAKKFTINTSDFRDNRLAITDTNQLTGPIPLELDHLTNLGKVDLSWNQLTGTIPPGLKMRASRGELQLNVKGQGLLPVNSR